MKVTKFIHSCLLVEMPGPVNRTILFDPGAMSEQALDVAGLEHLDGIVITHEHQDHFSIPLVKKLYEKFPNLQITTTQSVADQLKAEGIPAITEESAGIVFFDSPHADVEPLFPRPTQIGVHYQDKLTHPGDSHSFNQTKAVLALPVTGPWASTIRAINLALELKPHYVLPIHDWHWRDEAREQLYGAIENVLGKQGITFIKLETGQPVTLEV